MKKINFKQPKYVIPTLVYIGSLVIPYLFMEVFDVEIEDKKDANLQTTEYLNAQLPSANVSMILAVSERTCAMRLVRLLTAVPCRTLRRIKTP